MRSRTLFANYSCRFRRSSVLRVNLHTKSLRENVNLVTPRFRMDHTWHETPASSRQRLAHNIRYRSTRNELHAAQSLWRSSWDTTSPSWTAKINYPAHNILPPIPIWIIPKLIQSTLSTLTYILHAAQSFFRSYRFSASQEIPRILRNPKEHYRI